MMDKLLGIADLIPEHHGGKMPPGSGMLADHWYWCRQHQRAEHISWVMLNCIRIGPFMSEREANRLGDDETCSPLGMEVEL